MLHRYIYFAVISCWVAVMFQSMCSHGSHLITVTHNPHQSVTFILWVYGCSWYMLNCWRLLEVLQTVSKVSKHQFKTSIYIAQQRQKAHNALCTLVLWNRYVFNKHPKAMMLWTGSYSPRLPYDIIWLFFCIVVVIIFLSFSILKN